MSDSEVARTPAAATASSSGEAAASGGRQPYVCLDPGCQLHRDILKAPPGPKDHLSCRHYMIANVLRHRQKRRRLEFGDDESDDTSDDNDEVDVSEHESDYVIESDDDVMDGATVQAMLSSVPQEEQIDIWENVYNRLPGDPYSRSRALDLSSPRVKCLTTPIVYDWGLANTFMAGIHPVWLNYDEIMGPRGVVKHQGKIIKALDGKKDFEREETLAFIAIMRYCYENGRIVTKNSVDGGVYLDVSLSLVASNPAWPYRHVEQVRFKWNNLLMSYQKALKALITSMDDYHRYLNDEGVFDDGKVLAYALAKDAKGNWVFGKKKPRYEYFAVMHQIKQVKVRKMLPIVGDLAGVEDEDFGPDGKPWDPSTYHIWELECEAAKPKPAVCGKTKVTYCRGEKLCDLMSPMEVELAKQGLSKAAPKWTLVTLRQWLKSYCYMTTSQADSVVATFDTPANVISAALKLYNTTVLPRETSTGRDAERVFTDSLDFSKNSMTPATIGLLVSGFILFDPIRSLRASFVSQYLS